MFDNESRFKIGIHTTMSIDSNQEKHIKINFF